MLPEIITKARERLLVRARFLGSIALWLQWIEAPEVGTIATDGRHVWFCWEWCEAQGVRKTMGVIAHEVLHVVNKHHLRRGKRNPSRWNVAADLVVNRLLTDDAYELPSDGLFDRERRFNGLPVETVYLRLEQEEQAQQSGCEDNKISRARQGRATQTRPPLQTERGTVQCQPMARRLRLHPNPVTIASHRRNIGAKCATSPIHPKSH